MRLNKPIPMLLLLWPTLWALWLTSNGHPDLKILVIFVSGVILMRSVGCIINDLIDRDVDRHVTRTYDRPLTSGKLHPRQALLLAAFLSLVSFGLVLFCNHLTIELAVIGMLLAIVYPFLKRITYLPQVGLGAAFSWGIPMAFAAQTGAVEERAWYLFLAATIWPVIYDTIYAMVDRKDDIQIGIKSTAILFSAMDVWIIGLLQCLFILMLVLVGLMFHLQSAYYIALSCAALLFIYQQWLIKDRDEKHCFIAFLNNHWVGLVIFLGIAVSYLQ